MSNYQAMTYHPITKIPENALWFDNHYGRHRYGVKFSDGSIYPSSECELAGIKLEHLLKALDVIEKTPKTILNGIHCTYNQNEYHCDNFYCMHGFAHIIAYNNNEVQNPQTQDYSDSPLRTGIVALLNSFGGTPKLMRRLLSGDIKITADCRIAKDVRLGSGVEINVPFQIDQDVPDNTIITEANAEKFL